ncbi:hypothetical protein L484_003749 [Morus notabilis]|uniref:Uncharacterized protein n=1 Tax=Morus notabilis TaxID=981085 RepID=W9S4B8_9ROSA|nr:hypothetical protein L484_003749 [Morus notabilis]
MMSFVTNGRKNDTAAPVKDEDLSLFRELHQQKRRNQLLNPLSVSDEFDTTSPFPTHHDHPNGNYQIFRIPSNKKGSAGSDFLAENDKHDYDWPSKNNIIGNIDVQKPAAHNKKSKPTATSKNDVVHKPSSSTTTTNYTKTSISSASKERQYHNIILGYSNETPPNLRTEQRSSSATRGRAAAAVAPPTRPRQKSCSPSVTRGRKAEPILTVNKNKLLQAQEKNTSMVVGSRMVEKVMNARKSAIISSSTNNNTSSIININAGHRLKLDTKPNYWNSRPNQKSAAAFGLAGNEHNSNSNMVISKTLISREKARSK